MRRLGCAVGLAVMVTAAAGGVATAAERRLEILKSGSEFQSDSVRQMQADAFANPGLLWVSRGEALWTTPAGSTGKSCASCHAGAEVSMKGVATRYPAFERTQNRVLDLEARINACRSRHQGSAMLAAESDDLIGITAYVATQSRGLPLAVSIDGDAAASFARGQSLYYRRIGQLNLACNQCHEQNFERSLLNQPITQGHGNGYPAYRLDWQKMGSLQRRLRACFYGVRAELPAFGSDELIALELFLAWRAQGLNIETPAVRR
jgi:sulfur-oxidizing protein SoxA